MDDLTAAAHCDPGVLTRLTTSVAMIAAADKRVAVGASIWVEPGVIIIIRFIFSIKFIAYQQGYPNAFGAPGFNQHAPGFNQQGFHNAH